MAVYLGKNQVGVTVKVDSEDLDVELTTQEEKLSTLESAVNDLGEQSPHLYQEELIEQQTILASLEEDVNSLSDKPTDMLQARVDKSSCAYLFYGYIGDTLDFIKNLDTSNAISMSHMFYSCTVVRSIPTEYLKTSNVQYMASMFSSCTKLTAVDVSNFDTSKVTIMENMFQGCNALTSLDVSNFNTSNVTTMQGMFAYDTEVKSIDLSGFNTNNVTNFRQMFYSCGRLLTIYGKLDFINATNLSETFHYCTVLTDVTLLNIKKSLQLGKTTSFGYNLSNETLINTIQQLWDLTGSTSQTLTLSTTSKENIANIYVKLATPTQEQIDADPYINNKKYCVVCEPTDDGAMTLTEYATSKNWAIA